MRFGRPKGAENFRRIEGRREFIIFCQLTEYFLNIELKIDKCEHFNLLKDKKVSFYQEPREQIPKKANLYRCVFIL